jgi:hypothetical protein
MHFISYFGVVLVQNVYLAKNIENNDLVICPH